MNKCQLEGRLGKDPEVRFDKNSKPIASVSLATSNDYKPKDGGDWIKRPASWHNLVCFGPDAEALATYRKGDLLKIEGKISYESWEDKDGNKRTSTKIICFGVLPKEADKTGAQSGGQIPDEDVPF